MNRRFAFGLVLTFAASPLPAWAQTVAPVAVPPKPAAADSLYLLQPKLTGADGAPVAFDGFRGAPVLVSMFYASCPHVCPMLITTIKRIEGALTPEERGRVRVLMVSFDDIKDTPEALAALAKRQNVDVSRWRLTRAPAQDVRKIAALLGIEYARTPDGHFNHTTVVTLLDREGRAVARTTQMMTPEDAFVAALRAEAR